MNKQNPFDELFLTENEDTPEDIFVYSNIFDLMLAKRYGSRMITEAAQQAEKLEGTSEAKDIEKDIFVIRVNLNKINKAYNLAMN
ncbi:MAG: hypothetical protein V4580_17410 [Bacteroidota bacterium]